MPMYEKTEGNRELTYELVYDSEKLRELRKEIIERCSVRKNKRCVFEAKSMADFDFMTGAKINCNGDYIYKNIRNIKKEPINDSNGYWRPGDPVPYSFTADVLMSPKLVNFLSDIIVGNSVDCDCFFERRELHEKDDQIKKIEELDKKIDMISNFDIDKKIEALQELAQQTQILKDMPDFDYKLLSHYYDKVEESITLELVQEVIKYPKQKSKSSN